VTDLIDVRAQCVLGDPERAHAALPGLLVCDGHREALYEELRAIVDTVARIAIRPATTGTPGGGRSGVLASQRSVLDVESAALAGPQAPGEVTTDDGWDPDHPVTTVGSWARLVREERGIHPPPGPATLTQDVDLLVRQLDWCCAQPWIDDMAEEIRASLDRVRRADPKRLRPGDEGRCPAVGDGPDGTCGGHLRRERGAVPWVVHPDRCEREAVDVHAGVVRCQRCGATWSTVEQEALLHTMRADQARDALRPRTADGQPMRTARELAEDLATTLRAVQLRLHRLRIKPVMDRGMGWYAPDVLNQEKIGA
jgi:hypothetical protein